MKTLIPKEHGLSVHGFTFTIVQTWKQLKCPLTDGWLMKMWDMYMAGVTHLLKGAGSLAVCSEVDRSR